MDKRQLSSHSSQQQPRLLTASEKARIEEFQDIIHYSTRYDCITEEDPLMLNQTTNLTSHRYSDDKFEYRHVILPKNMLKLIPKDYFNAETGTLRILMEQEWRGLGITQSLGWVHYETHGKALI
jgi:cyclin-dependent kinase regulatory subunit CKS1